MSAVKDISILKLLVAFIHLTHKTKISLVVPQICQYIKCILNKWKMVLELICCVYLCLCCESLAPASPEHHRERDANFKPEKMAADQRGNAQKC